MNDTQWNYNQKHEDHIVMAMKITLLTDCEQWTMNNFQFLHDIDFLFSFDCQIRGAQIFQYLSFFEWN